jgi:hypothetical protein
VNIASSEFAKLQGLTEVSTPSAEKGSGELENHQLDMGSLTNNKGYQMLERIPES